MVKVFRRDVFFTDEQLNKINGSGKLDECIKSIFAVNNYIGRIGYLDKLIAEFNQYLAFDKWEVIRDNGDITLKKLDKINIENQEKKIEISENEFLKMQFEISVEKIGLKSSITEILSNRIVEIERNISIGKSLSSIILIGSVMEGILLGMAQKHPYQQLCSQFNPDKHTASICFQVLKAMITQISEYSQLEFYIS